MKKRSLVFLLIASMSVFAFLIESCQNQELSFQGDIKERAYAFLEHIYNSSKSLRDANIIIPLTRSKNDSAAELSDDEIWLFFDRPETVPPPYPGGPDPGETGGDHMVEFGYCMQK